MLRKSGRAGALGVLSALVASLAAGVPTAGAAGMKAACIVNGEIKARDKLDPDLGVRLVGGKGTFTAPNMQLACVSMEKGQPNVRTFQLHTEGTYSSTVCGTGKAVGSINTTDLPKVSILVLELKYAVEFVGTAGVFYWHLWVKDQPANFKPLTGTGNDKGEPVNKTWTPAGMVQLSPPIQKPGIPDLAAGECTKAFTLSGVIILDF